MKRAALFCISVGLTPGCGGDETAASPKSDAGCEQSCGGGGTGGGEDAAAGAGGSAGAPTGCVDIVVGPGALSNPGNWFHAPGPLPGGLFRTASGVHLAWIAYRYYPSSSVEKFLENTVPWLVTSTFAPESGASVGHSERPVFPDKVTTVQGGLFSFAGRSDDAFALGYAYTQNGERKERVLLGRMGDSDASSLIVPVSGDPLLIATQTAAAWDGEAFALHAYGAPPQFTLHVARVDDQGNVLLPFTQYGRTDHVGYGETGHKTSTSADSGRTYVFDSDIDNLLGGHSRDGTPLPGTGPIGGGKQVEAVGFPTTSSHMPAVAADGTGAWVGWQQKNTGPTVVDVVLQRLDLDGAPVGQGIKIFGPPLSELSRWTLLSRGPGEVWILGATANRVYAAPVQGGVVGSPIVVVDSASTFDVRNMTAFDYQDETWLAFSEQHLDYAGVLRVVRVKPGCVYPGAVGRKL